MFITVLIPTYGNCGRLRDALAAVCGQRCEPGSFEVIVIGHAGAEEKAFDTVMEASRQYGSAALRYFCVDQVDKHYAVNRGIIEAKGEVIALIDDDIIVGNDWIRNIIDAFSSYPAECAGGRIDIRWINGDPPGWIRYFTKYFGEINLGPRARKLTRGETVNAGNLMIRRAAIMAAGGYPPCNHRVSTVIGNGEVDLCNTLHRGRTDIYWLPGVSAEHIQDASLVNADTLRNKAVLNGKARAYTVFRAAQGRPVSILRHFAAASARCLLNSIRLLFTSDAGEKYPYYFRHHYHSGFISHLYAIASSKHLRKQVRIDDWISEIHRDTAGGD